MQRRQYRLLQMEDAAAWAVEQKPSGRNSDSSHAYWGRVQLKTWFRVDSNTCTMANAIGQPYDRVNLNLRPESILSPSQGLRIWPLVQKLLPRQRFFACTILHFLASIYHSLYSIECIIRRLNCAGIFEQSMGARNRVGIGLSYRPARLQRLAESIPWNRLLGSIKV